MTDIRALARALGGDVVGRDQLTFPGPGHSHRDRSATAWIDPGFPDGFRVHSHAGDDPLALRDYVRGRLGLPGFSPRSIATPTAGAAKPQPAPQDDAQRT